jgi:hypothetical protein
MEPPYRVATPDEITRYESELYPLQDRVLEIVGRVYERNVVLTGGTALARVYFQHRYSDDIDLFSPTEKPGYLGGAIAETLIREGLRVESSIVNPTFFRATISDGITSMKMDVAPDHALVQESMMSELGVYVHSLRDLAANKIGAFENRSEVKDVVDLYYIAQGTTWPQMFADAAKKRVPVAYEDLQYLISMPLSGRALLFKPISPTDFSAFINTLRSEIALEIKKKVQASRSKVDDLIASLLWDTPVESRNINHYTRDVIARRAQQLAFPQRVAVIEALEASRLATLRETRNEVIGHSIGA